MSSVVQPITSFEADDIRHGDLDTKATDDPAHIEKLPHVPDDWSQLRADAIKGEETEHSLTLKQGLRLYPSAIFWSFAISLCIVMEGYDTGLLGSITGLPSYREKYGYYTGNINGYQLSPAWQTAVGQASTIGNFFGIFLSSWAQDRWGYIRTIQVCLVLMIAFIFVVFFAPSIEVLFVGELLCGLPWGAFSSSAVSYASEITPVSLRGYLTTYVNLCWVIGQFIAAGVLVGVSGRSDEWAYKIPFAIQWIWPAPLLVLVTMAPESPWFLVRKGKLAAAQRSVQRLSKKSEEISPSDTVAMMVRTNQLEIDASTGTSYWDCFKGSNLRRTEIACLGWAAQVLSGSSFANQPTYFFEQAGLSTEHAFQLGLGTTALAFVGTCASWVTLTFFGRRTVYLSGLSVLTILLLLVAIISFPAETHPGASWGQAALIMTWVFTYDFTVGPIAYCIVGEVSSTRLRGKTVGLARNMYNVVGVVAGILNTYQINPEAWDWKGKAGFFWGGSCFLMLVWAYFRLPECKGRTFRDLDILFERGVPARRFKETVVAEEDDH